MTRIVVLGGSIAGLLAGIQLARRGHDVTVLERDPAGAVAPQDGMPQPRAGAPHAVQAHSFLARARAELVRTLPELHQALLAAGTSELRLAEGDDELVMLTARRHTFDRVLVEHAQATPGLDLRFGCEATGLLLQGGRGGSEPPRVTGVRTGGRETLEVDVLVDAGGRRSLVPRWLAAEGVELPLQAWDCGLVYFTRHYRVHSGVALPPLNRVFGAGGHLPTLSIVWFPGDNDTAMLAEVMLAEDQLLKRVRHPEAFDAVARSVPSIAGWIECSEPITPVFGMGALRNTLRRVVADGRPLVLGLHLAGDAACTTNPTLGRGISFAAAGVSRLVEVVDEAPDDAVAQALLVDDHVTREIEPRFVENALFDRARAATLRADLAGQPPPSPPPAPPSTDGTVRPDELLRASFADPVAYRANMRYQQLLDGASILSDPVVAERVRAALTPDLRMPAPAAPTRAELAELLG